MHKKVKRKFRKERYIAIGFFTLVIFILGALLGTIIEKKRVDALSYESKVIDIDYKSNQLQYQYFDTLEETNESCKVLPKVIEISMDTLSESLEKVVNYRDEGLLNDKEYELLERKYLLDNLKYWMFSNKANKKCNKDVVTVLYFYSDEECDVCPNQGVILTYYKKILQDELLVFPVNIDVLNEPLIDLLEVSYNVSDLPYVVIDEKGHSGFITKSKMHDLLCATNKSINIMC
jgi:hypothetical protein